MVVEYYQAKAGIGEVVTYPVGIGREGRSTPTGRTLLARKATRPTWYVPESIRKEHQQKGDLLPAAVSPGPDNPLGDYALYLSRSNYLIHGTNKPYSIGLRASNGCIRLYPENIEPLYRNAPVGTTVRIVNEPYLLGWLGGELYLEAHKPHEELKAGPLEKKVHARLGQIEKQHGRKLDWDKIGDVLRRADGIPVPVFRHSGNERGIPGEMPALAHPGALYGQPKTPPMRSGAWYIKALDTDDMQSARRLAVVLNHQGPQIPARAVSREGRYQVIAGPFENGKAARTAAKRMKFDLDLDGAVLPPTQSINLGAVP